MCTGTDRGEPARYSDQPGLAVVLLLSSSLTFLLRCLQAGAAADAVEVNGACSLLVACQEGHLECTELLIGARANINLAMHPHAADNEGGFTPLIAAAKNGHILCAKALLNVGADPNMAATVRSWNALKFAEDGGHANICALLRNEN